MYIDVEMGFAGVGLTHRVQSSETADRFLAGAKRTGVGSSTAPVEHKTRAFLPRSTQAEEIY